MRVALVQMPFPILPEEPRHLSPPLGLAYMAAALQEAGGGPIIVDALLEGYLEEWLLPSGTRAYGLAPERLARRLVGLAPDVVGLSCLFSTQDEILGQLAAAVRKQLPNAKLVLGGTHPTVFARRMLERDLADFVVRGEAEHAIVELVQALADGAGLADVSGLVWRDGGKIRENPVRRIAELESLPLPARRSLDLAAYSKVGVMHGESRRDVPATTIVTSRGCPARCSFCSIHPVWGYRFRAAPAARVLAEIAELYRDFGVRHLLIEDDNFTFDMNRAKTILRTMAADFPDLSWSAPNGVAIWRLDEELIRLIARTGCQRLSLAVESGCRDTLDRVIDKPLSLEQVANVVGLCRKHGIRTTAFFVLGTPGETRAAMLESMEFAAGLDVDTLTVMTAVPLPGSPLYDSALASGALDPDTPFTAFTTRNPILTTPDFDPQWVDRLARRTMMRHALRHPAAYLLRAHEKFRSAPGSTMQAVVRNVGASLRARG